MYFIDIIINRSIYVSLSAVILFFYSVFFSYSYLIALGKTGYLVSTATGAYTF